MSRFLLCLLLGLALPAGAQEPTVILLSWDGVRWDYPDRTELPALARMARQGVRAERLVPVFPTSTFPNHVSLATGARVDRHGIVANVFRDPERGIYRYSDEADWIEAEPLWAAAERQGVRTASFFWVGSETDWGEWGTTHRRAPFDAEVGEAEKVDQILTWLDLPEEERPRLIVSWWHGADATGHRLGPDHPDIAEQLSGQDAELARLLAGLDARKAWPHTTLIVVSDHGMTAVDGTLNVAGVLGEGGVAAEVFPLGGFGYVILEDRARLDDALALLGGIDGLEAYPSDQLPEALRARHPHRTGDITLIATPPLALWRANEISTRLYVGFRRLVGGSFGLHGYRPSHADMHAIFFAMGRGIPAGLEVGAVEAVDVAPTVSRLLALEPPRDSEGRAIPGIGGP